MSAPISGYIRSRRLFLRLTSIAVLIFTTGAAFSVHAAALRDDGIHFQPWIKISFLDMAEDAKEAATKGKGFVVLYEQPGCGSCKKLHEKNFSDKSLVDFITKNFDVVQINLFGDNEVTDFSGNVMSESAFAEKMKISFTPTTAFYAPDGTELFRQPGYFSPNFYKNGFKYVMDKGPEKGISYPRWNQMKRQERIAKEAEKKS